MNTKLKQLLSKAAEVVKKAYESAKPGDDWADLVDSALEEAGFNVDSEKAVEQHELDDRVLTAITVDGEVWIIYKMHDLYETAKVDQDNA